MPYLIGPIPRFRVSFPEAVQENIAEDEYVGDTLERGIAVYGDSRRQPDGFRAVSPRPHALGAPRQPAPVSLSKGGVREPAVLSARTLGGKSARDDLSPPTRG